MKLTKNSTFNISIRFKLIAFLSVISLCACTFRSPKQGEQNENATPLPRMEGDLLIDEPNLNIGDDIHLLDTLFIKFKLKELHDDALWRMYCIYCDQQMLFLSSGKEKYIPTIGTAKIITDVVRTSKKDHWTADWGYYIIGYNLFDPKDSSNLMREIDLMTSLDEPGSRGYNPYFCWIGIGYKKGMPPRPHSFVWFYKNFGRTIYFSDSIETAQSHFEKRTLKRLKQPLQPEVIDYIRVNAATIDTWFLSEAKKKGVFDSVLYPPAWVKRESFRNRKKYFIAPPPLSDTPKAGTNELY